MARENLNKVMRVLAEKLHSGVDGDDGYTEVYANPTIQEFRRFPAQNGNVPKKLKAKYGSEYHYCSAILTPTTLYAWDRSLMTHHTAKNELKIRQFDAQHAPLYGHYFPQHRVLVVAYSDWSYSSAYRTGQTLKNMLRRGHPCLKELKHLSLFPESWGDY